MKTQKSLIAFVMALALSALMGCSKTSGLKEGGLYYFANGDGTYSVMKVLKAESGGVHVKMYSNKFDSVPTKVDESKLYIVGRDAKANEIVGQPDVPLSGKSFEFRKPTFFQQSTVTDQELEGYKEWQKDPRYF